MSTPIKVHALPCDSNACGVYRVLQPLILLHSRGDIELSCREASPGRWILTEEGCEWADVVVIQKQAARAVRDGGAKGQRDLLEMVETHGRTKFIHETDDHFATLPKTNPTWNEHFRYDPAWPSRHAAMLAMCAAGTTTTEELAGRLRRHQPNMHVVRNGVDLAWWRGKSGDWAPPFAQPKERVRIGYLASRHHVEDVGLMIKPIREILARHPHVDFVLAGCLYPELVSAFRGRIECYPDGAPMGMFPAFARALNIDIGVAPLARTAFAAAKSAIKWAEYTALGCPTVASNWGPYAALGVDALHLADDTSGWVAHLEHLVDPQHGHIGRSVSWSRAEALLQERYLAHYGAEDWLVALREVVG